MRVIRELDLDGKPVQVRELTVGEIRAWLAGKQELGDVVDSLLFEQISLEDLGYLTDLQPEAIDALTPGQLNTVIKTAQEINADFFAMRERAVAIGQRILAAQNAPAA